jgi:hypothetical protein
MQRIAQIFTLLALALFVPIGAQCENSPGPQGDWITAGADAHVRIYFDAEAERWFGKILWLKDHPTDDDDEEEWKDINNPDPRLRDRPLLGLVILKNFRQRSANLWTGTAYDPESGKEYNGTLRLKDANTLLVKGYVGIRLFGRTETWTRKQ